MTPPETASAGGFGAQLADDGAALARLPEMSAVSGLPVWALKVPFSVQPVKALVFQPPLRNSPWMPTGDEST